MSFRYGNETSQMDHQERHIQVKSNDDFIYSFIIFILGLYFCFPLLFANYGFLKSENKKAKVLSLISLILGTFLCCLFILLLFLLFLIPALIVIFGVVIWFLGYTWNIKIK